jgi:uncharacterized protein (DUF1810 family)
VPDVDLQRFHDAQRDSYERALSEVEAGRKTSHWMWYVFPQVSGLGLSPTSKRYAIGSVDEARSFLADPILGARYRRIVDAVWRQVVEHGVSIGELFGSPDDAKLVSSLTLFAAAGRESEQTSFVTQADEILHAAYVQGLAQCTTTQRFLGD